jgi:hypothetical protein
MGIVDLNMMKKIFGLLIVGASMFWAYQSRAIDRAGAAYRVEFTGTIGQKTIGVYGWTDPKSQRPSHLDKINGTLPMTVSFNPPSGSIFRRWQGRSENF